MESMPAGSKTTLVTGAAGFIGSHLAERLIEQGHRVLGVDGFTPYYDRAQKEANLSALSGREQFRFLELDLRTADMAPHLDGVDWVFHQAAQPGVRASWDDGFVDYLGHNLLGTQRLLAACREASTPRFIFASSSSVYGNVPEGDVTEDEPVRPLSPYGVTKVASEKLVEVYYREFGLATVSLRYFTVCGPRQRPDMAFHKILRALHAGEPFTRYGDGTQQRDFTYVGDIVDANILAATKGDAGAVYNIGGGHPISLAHAISVLQEAADKEARIEVAPRADGDPARTAADLTRARRDLGYDPKVPVEEALRSEAAWFAGPEGPLARGGGAPR